MFKSRSSKVLAILLVIAVFLVFAQGSASTSAWFEVQENVKDNLFSAAKLKLLLNFGSPASLPFNVLDIAPGDSGEGMVTIVSDTGSIDANLSVSVTNFGQSENGCLQPEKDAGDPCGAGDLGLGLKMAMFVDVNQSGVFDSGDYELAYNCQPPIPYPGNTGNLHFSTAPNFAGCNYSDIITMSGGDQVDLVIKWKLPGTWNYPKHQNILMTDQLWYDVEILLSQN